MFCIMCICSELRRGQGGEEGVGGGVVTETLAQMGEAVDVAGAEDEGAA
jgi:hypothetical protein